MDESPHKEDNLEEAKEKLEVEEEKEPEDEQEEPDLLIESESSALISTDDLLGLNDIDQKAAEIEEANELALAITSNGNDAQYLNSELSDVGGTGWELALVSAPSKSTSHATESNLGGGFNNLLLDSLYEDDAARRQMQMQNAGYGYWNSNGLAMQNPFEQQQDPFVMSNSTAPPTNVQMVILGQQQQMFQQQQMLQRQQMFQQYQFQQQPQNMDMMHYQSPPHQYPQQQMLGMNSSNPFGDPFPSLSSNTTPQQYGSHGLL